MGRWSMSSGKSAPLSLRLSPSRLLVWGSGGCHLLAAGSLAFVAIPIAIKMMLMVLLGLSFIATHLCHGSFGSRWFIREVEWSGDGHWVLYNAQGLSRKARLLESYVHPRLVILNFALGRIRRRSVVILQDSADSEDIRRLRVRLSAYRRHGH